MGAAAGLISSIFGGGGASAMGGLMGGGGGGGIGSMVGGAVGSSGASSGANAGGLMGGGAPQMQGGGEAMDPEQAGIFNAGLAASQGQDMSAGQTPQTLMGSAAVAPQEKEKADEWSSMSDSDFEERLFSGDVDLGNMTPEQRSRVSKYLSSDEQKSQVAGGVGTPGEAMAQQIGMSGMGAATPQALPQTLGMGGLMGLSMKGMQQVPYRSNSGLMGGH